MSEVDANVRTSCVLFYRTPCLGRLVELSLQAISPSLVRYAQLVGTNAPSNCREKALRLLAAAAEHLVSLSSVCIAIIYSAKPRPFIAKCIKRMPYEVVVIAGFKQVLQCSQAL